MSMLKPDYLDLDKDGNKTEPMKEAVKDRDMKGMGGLLEDERKTYMVGGMVKVISKLIKKYKGKGDVHTPEFRKYMKEKLKKEFPNMSEKKLNQAMKDLNKSMGEGFDFETFVDIKDMPKDIKIFKNEGGPMNMDDQMVMVMTPPMKSDDDMEKDYTRFIMDEALSEEEEDMLVSKLEQDKELQMLFDKVIDVAQEFAGSGPVDGPGTGVSDDIPARLSDGEFVFTAKAVEEIGEDALMSMMKEAEAAADKRQGFAIGGMNRLEDEISDEESDDVSDDMRKVNPRLNPNVR